MLLRQQEFYGGIAQLARAHGSYPWCRGFESPSRYYKMSIKSASFLFVLHFMLHILEKWFKMWVSVWTVNSSVNAAPSVKVSFDFQVIHSYPCAKCSIIFTFALTKSVIIICYMARTNSSTIMADNKIAVQNEKL